MKRLLSALALVTLASCGADGEPVRPTANVGVSVGPGGVSTSASVSAKKGPFTLVLGL